MSRRPHPNSLNVQLSERASMSVPPETLGHAGATHSQRLPVFLHEPGSRLERAGATWEAASTIHGEA